MEANDNIGAIVVKTGGDIHRKRTLIR